MNEHLSIYIPAAIAVGLLAYFLIRRGRLAAAAAKGSRLREFGENIRLRDIFRLAVMMEEEGRSFYLRMVIRVRDPGTKELCASLAADEALHKQLFLDMLGHWNPLNPNPLTWPAFLERAKLEGFFGNAPGENATEDQLAAYAIRQELKSAEFYQLFEAAFPLEWKRERLHRLVVEEQGHAARLRAAYPHLNNNSD